MSLRVFETALDLPFRSALDRVVDKAQRVTSDAMDKAREVADRVSDEVARDTR